MKRLYNIPLYVNLFLLLLSALFSCSDDGSGDNGSRIEYDSVKVKLSQTSNDTIYYYNAAAFWIDHSLIKDTNEIEILFIKSKKTETAPSWKKSEFALDVIPLSEIKDSLPVEIIFFPGNITDEYYPVLSNYAIAEKKDGNEITGLKTLNYPVKKAVWTKSVLGSSSYYLGLLNEPRDTLEPGVTFRLDPTFNDLPGLPEYNFPSGLSINYEYSFFHVHSIDHVETPLSLKKASKSSELPRIVLSFYFKEGEGFLDDFVDEGKRKEHLETVYEQLDDFGLNAFDGIAINYIPMLKKENCEYFFKFIQELADRLPDKTISFHYPYTLIDEFSMFSHWEKIDHVVWSFNSLLPGDSLSENIQLPDYYDIEKKILMVDNPMNWKKIHLEFNPHIIEMDGNTYSCHHYSELLDHVGIKLEKDTLNENDTIRFFHDCAIDNNSLLNIRSFINWDLSSKMFHFTRDDKEYYYHNQKSIDYLIDLVRKYNFGGIYIHDVEKNDVLGLSEKFKLYYEQLYYPVSELKEEDFSFQYTINQKVYDSLYGALDTTYGPYEWSDENNLSYIIEPGIKKGDLVTILIKYPFTEDLFLEDTLLVSINNGKPYFPHQVKYSHNRNSVYIDTLHAIDPDNDTLKLEAIRPEGINFQNDSIFSWDPENMQTGEKISFLFSASDSFQTTELSYELLLTEQEDTSYLNGTTEINVKSPQMIYLGLKDFYYGNDSLYWLNGTNTFLCKIKTKKEIENYNITKEFLTSPLTIRDTIYEDDGTTIDTIIKTELDSGSFIYDSVTLPKDTVIYQPKRTEHYYQIENSLRLNSKGNFYISIFEVSNEEYKQFVLDNGYGNSQYWDFEIDGKNAEIVKDTNEWEYPKNWNSVNFYTNSQSPDPEGPVCGISLFEAVAYSKWLSEKLNATYRLPTDEEWERIACGEPFETIEENDSLIYYYPFSNYPWGSDFYPEYVNYKTDEDTKGVSKELFTEGRSVEGICHLLGNALEWTSSQAPGQEEDGTEKKYILKGGGFSYSNYTDIFHNKIIFRLKPESRTDDSGFRLIKE